MRSRHGERLGRLAASILALAASAVAGQACSRSSASARAPAVTAACAKAGLQGSACDLWSKALLPVALPAARGNRFADNPSAAELGFNLFFDPRALSEPGQNIACSRCHEPERGFSDRLALSNGVRRTRRNALALVNAARNYPHFWDGRADSLWSQPLSTIENEDEMNGTRLGVAHYVSLHYRAPYETVFGPLPDLSDTKRFPLQGKPGASAWEAMAPGDRDLVNGIYANVGKALEAYVRKLAAGESPVDRFFRGAGELPPKVLAGMRVFASAGCFQCHGGPFMTDGRFHRLDIPVPGYLAKEPIDNGRAEGVAMLAASDFNAASRFYDRASREAPIDVDAGAPSDLAGAFLTPSLRNVGDTGPYGHNGAFHSLEEVVRFHLDGGGPRGDDPLLKRQPLSDDDVASLVALLDSLHGAPAPLPWSFWPKVPKVSALPDADGGKPGPAAY